MKTERVKKADKNTMKSKVWLWFFIGFILGGIVEYVAYYAIVNWHSFFVVCEDGNRPDKNGCCSGEVYTDAGDGWMVCCPNGGDNCYPPLK